MTLDRDPGPEREGDVGAPGTLYGSTPGGSLPPRSPHVFSRREEKYDVDPVSAARLEARIARMLPRFAYRKEQPYTLITTVYFDTRDRDFYLTAERDYDHNVKIRVREYYYPNGSPSYLTEDRCYVELKQRALGTVTKKRFAIPKCELQALLSNRDVWPTLLETTPPSEIGPLREAYTTLRRYLEAYRIEVTSVVTYRRKVYQKDESDLRITLDDQLSVFRPFPDLYADVDALTVDVLGAPIRSSDRVILEIKCPGEYPAWLREAMAEHTSKRLSKFTTSVRLVLGHAAAPRSWSAEAARPENGAGGPRS